MRKVSGEETGAMNNNVYIVNKRAMYIGEVNGL